MSVVINGVLWFPSCVLVEKDPKLFLSDSAASSLPFLLGRELIQLCYYLYPVIARNLFYCSGQHCTSRGLWPKPAARAHGTAPSPLQRVSVTVNRLVRLRRIRRRARTRTPQGNRRRRRAKLRWRAPRRRRRVRISTTSSTACAAQPPPISFVRSRG